MSSNRRAVRTSPFRQPANTFADRRASTLVQIGALIETATHDKVDVRTSLIYTPTEDLEWLFSNSNDESFRVFKHWTLLIEYGLVTDTITVEFMENSLDSKEGLVKVTPYDRAKAPTR
ncbi:MAG: hypothetical protein J3R72DRAFT_425264 [Linnemannia gamsii]|nr:MAG: hypothetical protein J3R72DRAFT_425264 [Linnemannia gamsii]